MWSWFLASLSVPGYVFMWKAGNGRRWAWLGNASLGLPWFAYASLTSQWGFVATTAISVGVNVRNFIHHEEET